MIKNDFKLYRYDQKEFLERMMANGEIRITTLSYCRNSSNPESRDENEGKKTTVEELKGKDNIEKRLKEVGFNVTYIKGNVNMQTNEIMDCYIYCTSVCFNQELLNRKGRSCIEIFDPINFLLKLDKKLSEMGLTYPNLCFGDYMKYVGHTFQNDDSHAYLSPNWLKDNIPQFVSENEYRFSFVPIRKRNDKIVNPIIKTENEMYKIILPDDIVVNIEPVTIECKEAIEFCRWKVMESI